MNTKWKILKKIYENYKEREKNNTPVAVCYNSFGVLMEFDSLEEDNNKKVSNQESVCKQKVKDKVISNILSEIKIKNELHKVEIVIT